MLKVLVVDDEMLVRTNIRMILDWESHGFTICAEASNGSEALQMIARFEPEIVIFDVKMPEMDGYKLSSIIVQKYRNIKMIVLSNYDDFEYVRGTLKNGAVDYILKHNLNQTILLDSLNRARDSLADTNKKKFPESYTINNIIMLREKLIMQLLTGFYGNDEEIKKQFDLLGINLGFHNILPVVMEIDNYKIIKAPNSGILKDKSLLEYSILNITDGILHENKTGIVVHISDKLFAILLSFPDVHSQTQIQLSLDSILNSISTCLRKFLEITISFSIGPICNEFTEVSKSYEYAVNCLKNKFYTGNGSILKNSLRESKYEDMTGLSLDMEKQIFLCLRTGDSSRLLLLLENLFTSIKNEVPGITSTRMILYDLLNIAIKTCKENNIELTNIFSSMITPQEVLSTIQTIDESKNWIMSLFNKLIILNNRVEVQYNSEYVQKTVQFIKRNYSKNISLSDAAEEIEISSTYLSKLFKEEVGIGFAEYLGNLRIEKAKYMLEAGKHKMKDIMSKCGFNNYDYFIKFFKKKAGCTPKEYLAELKEK